MSLSGLCVCVCHRGKPASRWANIGIPVMPFFFVLSFRSLQARLLCKLGELPGGGSVVVAVDINDS